MRVHAISRAECRLSTKSKDVNKQAFFATQLANCLFETDWHFKTLLGASIQSTKNFPNDGDTLINELLLHYPFKPSLVAITEFLLASERLAQWFTRYSDRPRIIRFALQPSINAQHTNQPLPDINTVGDLAEWLSLTMTELDWFTNRWRSDASTPEHLRHYHYDFLKKRDGGIRLIEKPKVRLKILQRNIYQQMLMPLETHPAAHGFCKDRNCVSHASKHVGKQYLISYDIADCFHSINWPTIKAVFRRLGYADEVAVYLTALCSHQVQLDYKTRRLFNRTQRERLTQRHLPQGAPTSPALANAALSRLDLRLSGLANTLDMDYSRYADDIALSSDEHRDWRFLEPLVGGICLDEGVSLNHRKTRIKRAHQKQRLVGIVVNRKTNIDRQYFDVLKATLTNCKRHGIESQNQERHPHFRAHLLGRIQHVKSLNEQRGIKLERIFRQIST